MSCELVISGWYATAEARSYAPSGDDLIRSVAFRPLWWRSLDTFVRPEHVFIVDSASPLKPADGSLTASKFQHVELLINPGHSQNGKTHYCGWMAGVIMGLEFALLSDVDMVIYVEQDVLTFGRDIVDKVKDKLRRKDLVFGAGSRVDVQQSFFALNKRGIRHFLSALHAIDYSDKRVAPEQKFMFAASKFLPGPVVGLAAHTEIRKIRGAALKIFARVCSMSKNYEILPFGYGRRRPIDFDDQTFYFQHGSQGEVSRYRTLTGF